jgi:Domain of unknown function (DUF4387)
MVASAATLRSLARVVRSKNAGPLCLTLDLFFLDEPSYARAAGSPALSVSAVAALYGLPAEQVRRFDLPHLCAIKLTLPRRLCAGDPGDGDVYGAQQHGPLLELVL